MKTMTRSEALALLRQKCMALVDDDRSLCQVAADLKIGAVVCARTTVCAGRSQVRRGLQV